MTALAKLDAPAAMATLEGARRALAAVRTADDALQVRAGALALADMARRQKLGEEAAVDASVIARQAERILGQHLATGEDRRGRGRVKRCGAATFPAPTLADIGISRSQSSRWQAAAALPEDRFEALAAEHRDAGRELTADAVRQAAAGKPHRTQGTGEERWYTPPAIVEAARAALGGIDLDPASDAEANKVVKAARFYTADDDGLRLPWRGRVWLNPPYTAGIVGQFVARFLDAPEVEAGIVLVNNGTETRWGSRLLREASAVCFPAGRVRFLTAGFEERPSSPLQGQLLAARNVDPATFARCFEAHGPTLSPLESAA